MQYLEIDSAKYKYCTMKNKETVIVLPTSKLIHVLTQRSYIIIIKIGLSTKREVKIAGYWPRDRDREVH